MCGIAGTIDFRAEFHPDTRNKILGSMLDAIRHRGPDDSGIWQDQDFGIAMGHRRLSILDLSPLGHQPMKSKCGRYQVVFNGEIYNFTDMRTELESIGERFLGGSDTEVMLAGFSCWGISATVPKMTGMFAIAVWDDLEKRLILIRDRFAEKPLYYGWVGNHFLFSSELKSLRKHPKWTGSIDRNSLSLFLTYNYVPSPYSIHEGISKLSPGSMLTIQARKPSEEELPPTQETPYWSVNGAANTARANPFRGSDEEALNAFDALIRKTVKRQMVSDVPLGAFLSGGIDSSLIVAAMQKESPKPVKTFTIGFQEKDFDEAPDARMVARHLGTEHTELYATPKQALEIIPLLPQIYDEPFSDPSGIPTYLVCSLTKKYVTVCLSGDGGDELMGGYNRYFWTEKIWNQIRNVPRPLRSLAAHFVGTPMFAKIADLGSAVAGSSRKGSVRLVADKIGKLSEVITSPSKYELFQRLISQWKNTEEILVKGMNPSTLISQPPFDTSGANFIETMMLIDSMTYLPDDIMVKVDRAAMAVSLETRAPYLDHNLFEFAWTLPLDLKVRGNTGKWLLRQALYKYVPKELVDRPKMGFGVPIGDWLRGPLKEWAAELLDANRIKREGFLHSGPITRKWEEHLSGRRNWQYYLWNILMFQAWLESQRN